ncbi:IS3 family transposase [Streptomyces sp. H27-D2]|uniref:IS3 family transposase n=1 Tax=Streptomyces sp. H27-D2 TaxID=3046304 RepID=UPI003FA71102
MRHAFTDSDETYGYRRVHASLRRLGVQAGLELVRALMRELGLVSCQPKPWRTTTVPDAAAEPTPTRRRPARRGALGGRRCGPRGCRRPA